MADDLDPSENPFGRPDAGSPLHTPPVPPPVPKHTKQAVAAAHLAPLPQAKPASPPAPDSVGGMVGAMVKPSGAPGEGIAGRSAGVASGLARSFGHVAMEGIRGQGAAGRKLVEDVTGPQTDPLANQPGGQFTQDIMGVAGGGFIGGVAKAALGEPVAAAVNPTVRKVTKAVTGSEYEVDPQRTGDLATMAIPFLGEANEARAASAFAKEAGISEQAAREALAVAREAEAGLAASRRATLQTEKARRAAALRLIKQPEAGRKLGVGGEGELDAAEALKKGHEFRKVGAGENPTLMDVAGRPTLRFFRGVAAKGGKPDSIFERFREAKRKGIGDAARGRALEESPNPEVSTAKRIEDLGHERDTRADTLFPEPYRKPIKTDDHLFNILFNGFPEGPRMVRSAMDDASRRMLTDPDAEAQFNQLKSLHQYIRAKARFEEEQLAYQGELAQIRRANPNATPEELEFLSADVKKPVAPEPPTISAGALDRIFRQARDTAADVTKGTRTTRGGIGARARQIGEYLDNIPELKEARADYKDYTKRIEVLQFKENLSRMLPREFQEYVSELSPEQLNELKNKVIEDYATAFGTSSRKMQSEEDLLTFGSNAHDNLRILMGKDEADRFVRAIDLLGKSIDHANFVDSGVGSQSKPIEEDLEKTAAHATVAATTGWTHRLLYIVGNFLGKWFTTTPEQNEIIAEWATGRMDEEGKPTMTLKETLQDIVSAVQAKDTGKITPLDKSGLKSLKVSNTGPPATLPPEISAILAGAALREKPQDEQGEGQEAEPGQTAEPPDAGPLDPAQNPFGKGAADGETSPDPTQTATEPETQTTPEMEGLLHQVAVLEGSGDNSISPAGAIGKYQIWPRTALQYGLDPDRLFDPEYNKQAAVMILGDLNQRYGGDLGAILVAYNGGPGRADEWLAAGKDPRVLKPETRGYLYRAGLLGADALGSPDPGGGIAGPSPDMSSPLIPNFGLSDGQ